MIVNASLLSWLLMLTLALGCRADYTLMQTYHSYLNPLHSRDNGVCCESQGQPPSCPTDTLCDNVFTICGVYSGQTLPKIGNISPEDCSLGHYLSQTYYDNDNITNTAFISVTFSGVNWPGSIQLLIQVYDKDSGSGNPDDFVDDLIVELSLSPSSSPTPPRTYTSSAEVFTIVISFRLECTQNFYGDACDVFCEPRNDDALGHYTCSSDGERVCSQGYHNPESNCTACVPASGCLNGVCEEPGQCLCHEGYGGDLCSEILQSNDNRMTYIVVGVVVGVTVVIVITMVTVVLVVLWNISGTSHAIMPGDNPIYMSAADLRGEQLSTAASHSPPHSTTATHSPPHSTTATHSPLHSTTASHSPPTAATPELVPELVIGGKGDVEEGDTTCTNSSNTHSTTRVNLDPYGNYGDKTIAKVAGMAPPSPLFDDSKYVEWSPSLTNDTDDVDSDGQSEYL